MRILIADDHSVVRRGLQQIIATRPGWSVAAEVSTLEEVLPALRGGPIDVVVLDVSFGAGRSGIDLLSHIRSEFRALPVLMLTMHAERQYAVRCLRAGASGYIQKDSSPEELLAAIDRVASGRTYVSEQVTDQMATELVRGGHSTLPHERLSSREFEVFRLIASGKSPTEIAEMLTLSIKTVSTYRARILEKMNFRSNADIVTYAIRNRVLE
ncbi:MAG TPA: response regulator transcription factor [Thermoanaerobaculia bacterium]